MKKFALVLGGFLLGVTVMLPFIPEISSLDHTLDSPSRVPGVHGKGSVSSASVVRLPPGIFMVTHVVDGDTIDVVDAAGTTERVRFIGIDTPETVDPRKKVQCFGPEASARMKALVLDKNITLEKKPQEDRDSFGRELRYVYVDKKDIGLAMLEEGYAVSLCKKFPHPKCQEYDAAVQKAEAEKLGRWAVCGK